MNKKLFDKYIKVYGVNSQLIVCVEELAELIQSIQKYMRCSIDKENEQNEILDNLHEEIADVDIMIGQMKNIFDNKLIKKYKNIKLKKMRDKIEIRK